MKKIVVLFVLLVLVFMIAGCSAPAADSGERSGGQTSGAETSQPQEISSEDISEGPPAAAGTIDSSTVDIAEVEANIDVEAIPALSGEICVFITNNNSFVVDDIEVQVIFKDESGNLVGEGSDGHDMVLPGSTVVSAISDYDIPDSYNTIEASVRAEVGINPSYENHAEQVSIKTNAADTNVMVEITNNSDILIEEIEYVVVFYKGDAVAGISGGEERDVRAGDTVIQEVSGYAANDDFDRFEIYINQAHTFGL